ncbi:MAG: GAF domain-containing protein [Gammaproteobacteria bacterium]|nr:GAF domain-containing protein [Gammaproteobacteria bacterium]
MGGRGDTAVKHCIAAGMDPAIADKVSIRALDRGQVGKAYRDRESIRLSNPSGDPAELGLPAEHPPVHSALVAPVVSLKHVYGWICLMERIGSAGFSEEDQKLLTILAAQVGRIYENGDLYLEVQKSEQKFRQLTDHIHEVFFLVDPELTHTEYVSPAYEEIWRRSVDDLYTNPRGWLEAVHADDREIVSAVFADARSTGRFDDEYRILQPGGDTRCGPFPGISHPR